MLNELPYLQKCVANIDLLVRATGQKRKVLLKNYASNERNRFCNRIIEPYDYPFYYNYTWAYDCQLQRNVLLRCSRMDEVQVLDEYWDNEEQHRRQNMHAWGCYGHRTKHVKLRLTMQARNLMTEAHPISMITMKEDPDYPDGQRWIADLEVYDNHWNA